MLLWALPKVKPKKSRHFYSHYLDFRMNCPLNAASRCVRSVCWFQNLPAPPANSQSPLDRLHPKTLKKKRQTAWDGDRMSLTVQTFSLNWHVWPSDLVEFLNSGNIPIFSPVHTMCTSNFQCTTLLSMQYLRELLASRLVEAQLLQTSAQDSLKLTALFSPTELMCSKRRW